MNEHSGHGISTAPFTDGPIRDVPLARLSTRRQDHPVLSPVIIRLLMFVTVALTFSGLVKHLVYALYWWTSGSARAS